MSFESQIWSQKGRSSPDCPLCICEDSAAGVGPGRRLNVPEAATSAELSLHRCLLCQPCAVDEWWLCFARDVVT